jgi:hypothetical protein
MAGLVPAIHVFPAGDTKKDVDARHKAGHDESFERLCVKPLGAGTRVRLAFSEDHKSAGSNADEIADLRHAGN